MYMIDTLKGMPPVLFSLPMRLVADGGGMAVETEPFHQ